MEYFLPIAEVYVNLPLIFILSLVVGILSGLFGVGGGFLMTPFLIFLGVPPAYAVPNEANNILATSVSGSLTHWFKNTLDYKIGFVIVIGGVIGTFLGIIPQIFIMVSLGSGLEKIIDKNEKMPTFSNMLFSPDIYYPIVGFFVLFFIVIIVKKFFYK